MVKKGWSRTYVNAQVDKIRRVFQWGASEQLLPAAIYNALRTVTGLRRGKTAARRLSDYGLSCTLSAGGNGCKTEASSVASDLRVLCCRLDVP
jgi:hypothetical protein